MHLNCKRIELKIIQLVNSHKYNYRGGQGKFFHTCAITQFRIDALNGNAKESLLRNGLSSEGGPVIIVRSCIINYVDERWSIIIILLK